MSVTMSRTAIRVRIGVKDPSIPRRLHSVQVSKIRLTYKQLKLDTFTNALSTVNTNTKFINSSF